MHRIDTKTAQKDKFGAGKNGFTRGNPQTGTPATDLDDDYFDMLQEELCSVVEASGASLEKARHDQLLTALRALLLSRKNPFGDIKSDGTVQTALENLGLGTLQSSFTDKTGKIALNGGWGLGIKADQVSGTMAALDVSRFDYFAPADNIGPYPGQWAGGISFANSGSTGWQICGASLGSIPDFSVRIKTNQTAFSDWYKLYHTGFKPTPADINAIQRDACDVAGFISNNQQDPYMRHSASNNIIQLATRQFVSQSISSLSLGTAATKNVGTGAGQIPDMSSFTSGTGWASLPGGTIIQWGIAVSGQIGDPQTINFPVPFTNYSTVQLVASYDNAGASGAPYSFAAQPISNTQFKLLNSTSSSAVIYARWIAIGR
ncbi:TPA: hypothetical protein HNN89_21300 [Escherichia coli]|nr:hypothetical protein [Escherichia coli]